METSSWVFELPLVLDGGLVLSPVSYVELRTDASSEGITEFCMKFWCEESLAKVVAVDWALCIVL